MTLARVTTWSVGQVLTSTALNAEFDNILNNPNSLINAMTAAAGDIFYASAANVWGRLAVGTNGQVMQVTASLPAWVTGTGTGSVVLATSPTLVTPILGVATATSLTLTQTASQITTDTADASDTKGLLVCGGGATGPARGAMTQVYGNEHASQGGRLYLDAGNVSTGDVILRTGNNIERARIKNAGAVNLAAFVFANIATVLAADGDYGYCSDCGGGNPGNCGGAGTGAFAMRLNGTARCWG